jgi:hypothetical protein
MKMNKLIAGTGLVVALVAQAQQGGSWTNPSLMEKGVQKQQYDAVFRAHQAACSQSAKDVVRPILTNGGSNCGPNGPVEFVPECDRRKERAVAAYKDSMLACMTEKGWLWMTPIQ